MKRNLMFSIMATGLALLPFASANAYETGTNSPGATAIVALPFTISSPGNYYLATDLSTVLPAGAAITIEASGVILDLNGRTLSNTTVSNTAYGIFVFNQVDVTIQNGNVDSFAVGVFFAPSSTDVNAKNTALNLRLNSNTVGVESLSGTSNLVRLCIIDGGSIGIWFRKDLGSRAEDNILELQAPIESNKTGVALVSTHSLGVVFDNNVVAKGTGKIGQIMSGTDKYRFESFVGFAVSGPVVGGTDEEADSN